MFRNVIKLIILQMLVTSASELRAESGFSTIYRATSKIVAGRNFQNDEGLVISFSDVFLLSNNRAVIDVTVSSANSGDIHSREYIIGDEDETIMHEVINREARASYLVSVEAPFNVLRIRPQLISNNGFISRECFFQPNEKLNVCYYKFKTDNEVYVSVFKEIKASN